MHCGSAVILGVMQLVGILQYKMLYVNGRRSFFRLRVRACVCVFGPVVVLTALLGSWCTPLWSCPAADPSGIRRSASRLLPPCWRRPQCGPPPPCDYEGGKKKPKKRRSERREWVSKNNRPLQLPEEGRKWISASTASPPLAPQSRFL